MTLCAFVKASPINPVITRAIIKPIINPDVSLSSSNTAPIPYPPRLTDVTYFYGPRH